MIQKVRPTLGRVAQTFLVEPMTTRGADAVGSCINRLKEIGINLLAIDFDNTILDTHTRGRWNGTQEELLPHVRREFQQIIAAARQNEISVAVVTFTAQVNLVKGVLESIVGQEEAERIPIRGNDRSWSYHGGGSREGKQPYIASAVEELEQSGDLEITKQTTVLIDDDQKNISVALSDGVRAVWFNPAKPHHIFQQLAKLP